MVMYFTEEDLVSFGSYLLSSTRANMVRSMSDGLSDEDITTRLKNVSDADLSNWAYLVNQAEQQRVAEQNQ